MSEPTSEQLLERMLQGVFNEPDPQHRAEVIAEVFAADVVFVDGERTVTGQEELAAAVTGLLAQGPGLVFTPAGPFRGVGDLGLRPWRLGPPGGEPVLGGLDVAQTAAGRITRLWTVLDG
ncbi:nuclear transport factor 2 family protein [Modestobacter excelsi]|uniref:nuclear transport factor 2 family protein n=1 Tax=Modestobacter excelsi TaxID=2213161 RepID=UPI001C20DAB8|nr:nuclear transport factor 2 family protein [Modestobacter excelsi]